MLLHSINDTPIVIIKLYPISVAQLFCFWQGYCQIPGVGVGNFSDGTILWCIGELKAGLGIWVANESQFSCWTRPDDRQRRISRMVNCTWDLAWKMNVILHITTSSFLVCIIMGDYDHLKGWLCKFPKSETRFYNSNGEETPISVKDLEELRFVWRFKPEY